MQGRMLPDRLWFPISGSVPGGTERKTAKMMRVDLASARHAWIAEASTDDERNQRGVRLPGLLRPAGPVRRLPFEPPHLHHQPLPQPRLATDRPNAHPPFGHPADDADLHPYRTRRPTGRDRLAPRTAACQRPGGPQWRHRAPDDPLVGSPNRSPRGPTRRVTAPQNSGRGKTSQWPAADLRFFRP